MSGIPMWLTIIGHEARNPKHDVLNSIVQKAKRPIPGALTRSSLGRLKSEFVGSSSSTKSSVSPLYYSHGMHVASCRNLADLHSKCCFAAVKQPLRPCKSAVVVIGECFGKHRHLCKRRGLKGSLEPGFILNYSDLHIMSHGNLNAW